MDSKNSAIIKILYKLVSVVFALFFEKKVININVEQKNAHIGKYKFDKN